MTATCWNTPGIFRGKYRANNIKPYIDKHIPHGTSVVRKWVGIFEEDAGAKMIFRSAPRVPHHGGRGASKGYGREGFAVKYNDGVKMDDDLRVVECPRCGNEQISTDAKFCRICGLPVYNYCAGKGTSHICPGNARFCGVCGEPTEYFELGILRSWDATAGKNDGGIDFSSDDDEICPF